MKEQLEKVKQDALAALAAAKETVDLENIRVKDKAAVQADPDVRKAVEEATEKLGDTGRILVRESGTEPVIRVMVEAESEEICRGYVEAVISVIRKKGQGI